MSMQRAVIRTAKKLLPPISRTEQEALESGTVGWDGELMKGSPDWRKLFALKKPEFTAEEQAFLDGPVEQLCGMLDTWQIQQTNDLPQEVWNFIREKGFMGLEIPKEYGGLGFSSSFHSAVVIKIASRNISAAVTVMVPNSLGPAELIHEYGTKEQKDYYLPRLAKGIEIPCFALTGPDAGSDAGSIPDLGIVCKNDKGELGMRINWEKRYITLGPVATLIGLAFNLEDPENLLGKNKKDLGITVALVPRDTPGVEIGERHKPMDLPFQNGPNRGKDVFIPIGNIIGGADMAGHGWRMLMECLAVGRSLSLPALSVAGAKLSCYTTGAYGRVRKQFNTQIARFEGVEEVLARMAGTTYWMNAARAATLQMVDDGEKPAIPSAILKYHLTEGMRATVNDAMDVHGGKAICNGPNNIFADIYKGIPVAITVEGANIMTRNLIIFGQGAVRAHPYVLKYLEAVNEESFGKLMKTFGGHLCNIVTHLVKSLFHGLTGSIFSRAPHNVHNTTKKFYRRINRLSAALNFSANVALPLGGNLKRKERFSARMGDIFSQLYLASTTLWYFEKQGRHKEDLPLVKWACTNALYNAQQSLDQMIRNHPYKIMRILMRPIIFPLGRCFQKPCDRLDAAAADCIRNPGPARDRLTAGIYKPAGENEPLGRQELAMEASIATEELEKKLYKAGRDGKISRDLSRHDFLEQAKNSDIITADEYNRLKNADRLRRAVVMVDAF